MINPSLDQTNLSVELFLQTYTERTPIVTTHINCITVICFFFGLFDFFKIKIFMESRDSDYQNTNL